MNLRKLLAFLVFILVVYSNASSLHAETLKVGLGALDYPPFYFVENESLTGAAVEIAEAVAARAGYQLNYQRVPWKRLQNMLKVGQLDMVILYFQTPERAEDVSYTRVPHIYENSSVVIPKGLTTPYDGSIHSLADFDIFYVRGYSHGAEFDQSSVLKKHAVVDEAELLHRVISGRPFIGVGNKPALLTYAERSEIQDKIDFLSPPFDRGENYMAFSKQRADADRLAELFSDAFEHYAQTESYLSILRKYGFSTDVLY